MKDDKLIKLERINKHILVGLRDLASFTEVPYWIMGSVVCAALNERFYRKIGDIDVLIDENNFITLKDFLENKSYTIMKRKPWNIVELSGFSWVEAIKGKICISIVRFRTNKTGCFIPLRFGFSAFVPKYVFEPKKYKLYGVEFYGLSPESLYYRIQIEYGKNIVKHREKDLVLLSKNIDRLKYQRLLKEKPGLYFLRYKIPVERAIAPFFRILNLQRK